MKKLYFVMLFLAYIAMPHDYAYAFRPRPPNGTPFIFFSIDGYSKGDLDIDYYLAQVTLLDDTAHVMTDIRAIYKGNEPKTIHIIPSPSIMGYEKEIDVVINDQRQKYSFDAEPDGIEYSVKPQEALRIKIFYSIGIGYTFSGPPGRWKGGYNFTVHADPIIVIYGKESAIIPINRCKLNLKAPKEYLLSTDLSADHSDDLLKIQETDEQKVVEIENHGQCFSIQFYKYTK